MATIYNDTTIVHLPTIWYARNDNNLTSLATGSSVLSANFTLYFPYTASPSAAVTPTALASALNGDGQGNGGVPLLGSEGTFPPSIINEPSTTITGSANYTFFLPVTTTLLPTFVDANEYLTRLPDATGAGSVSQTSSSSGSSGSSGSSDTSSASTTPITPVASSTPAAQSYTGATSSIVSATDAGQASAGSLSSTASAGNTSQSTAGTAAPANNTTSSTSVSHTGAHISTGDLVGGTLGGFFGGLLLCSLIAFCCIRGRPSRRKATDLAPDGSVADKATSRDAMPNEKQPIIVGSKDVTGWRKHLPQEKSTDRIIVSFGNLFEQACVHVEGYYESDVDTLSADQAALLRAVAPEDLSTVLLHTRRAIPALEAILLHWIVHRVSLRSEANASLLPPEYTGVPQKSQWHMENDVHDRPLSMPAESKKGFPQAFSEWRALTGFLYPDPKSDHLFQQRLNQNINEAVEQFAQAYLPWSKPGESRATRDDGLRRILHDASDAGIQLFQQPSTFMFDWPDGRAAGNRTLIVAPALVRRLDEHGEPLRPVQVLIEARRETI